MEILLCLHPYEKYSIMATCKLLHLDMCYTAIFQNVRPYFYIFVVQKTPYDLFSKHDFLTSHKNL